MCERVRERVRERVSNEWVNEWMNDRINEWMNEWVSEWMNECMNEWVSEWVSEWGREWVNEWMNEWMNEWFNVSSRWNIKLIKTGRTGSRVVYILQFNPTRNVSLPRVYAYLCPCCCTTCSWLLLIGCWLKDCSCTSRWSKCSISTLRWH